MLQVNLQTIYMRTSWLCTSLLPPHFPHSPISFHFFVLFFLLLNFVFIPPLTFSIHFFFPISFFCFLSLSPFILLSFYIWLILFLLLSFFLNFFLFLPFFVLPLSPSFTSIPDSYGMLVVDCQLFFLNTKV